MVRRQPFVLLFSLIFCAACAPAPSEPPASSTSTPAPSAPAENADSNATSAVPSSNATMTRYTQADAAKEKVSDGAEGEAAEAEASLTIGDKAPAVAIGKWVHGTEVEKFKKDSVYVVEFWATWCGPCRASMPHIASLQTEYGDRVKFIGVTDEDAETVKTFLEEKQGEEEEKTWQEVITYALALDKDSKTSEAYMRAAGQNGIPTAFIVGKQGLIEWIGHPGEIDEPLKAVVDGSWNRDEYAVEFKKKQEADQVMMALNMAAQAGDWDKALTLIEKIAEADPNNPRWAFTKIQIQMRAGRHKEANVGFGELAKNQWEDPRILNFIAWTMLTEMPEGEVDAAQAQKIVERANELSDGKDGSVLDTMARAYYVQGNVEKAVEIQEKAVEIGLPGNDEALKKTLEQYKSELADKAKEKKPAK